ncbi:MAG: ABC transporter permease [Candidatus Eisenbacteria bacterium]|nr:ABC transporter permease [Candidatus Eisenbacteria bacterium]
MRIPLPGLASLRAGAIGTALAEFLFFAAPAALLAARGERALALVRSGDPSGVASAGAALALVLCLAAREALGGRGRGGRRRSPFLDRFRDNRLALAGLVAMGVLYAGALFTPLLATGSPSAQNIETGRHLAPSADHPLGTDKFGRDVWTRILYGSRVSLTIGFVSVAIAISIGTLVGAVTGYFRGWVDGVLMRLTDVLLAFPRLVLLLAVIALFRPSIFLLVAVLGATGWMGTARIVRGEVLSLREREFVLAARALGYRAPRVIVRHILPNLVAPIVVAATLNIGHTIILEASLSFLGLGVQPPAASWGSMINDGRDALLGAWWVATFPGLAIVGTVIAFNLVGDGLRDALDPRTALPWRRRRGTQSD